MGQRELKQLRTGAVKKASAESWIKIVYKLGLLVFYFTNFIYPIIVAAVEQAHIGYNVVCGLISFIGLCFELYDIIPDIYHYIKQWKEKRHKLQEEEDQKAVVVADNDTTEENPSIKEEAKNEKSNKKDEEMEEISYAQKTKYVFKEFVLESLGEILIYPSIICSLYAQAAIIFGILVVIIIIMTLYFIWVATHPKQMVKKAAKKAYREYRRSQRNNY